LDPELKYHNNLNIDEDDDEEEIVELTKEESKSQK
jgi:hypothetical protein